MSAHPTSAEMAAMHLPADAPAASIVAFRKGVVAERDRLAELIQGRADVEVRRVDAGYEEERAIDALVRLAAELA